MLVCHKKNHCKNTFKNILKGNAQVHIEQYYVRVANFYFIKKCK